MYLISSEKPITPTLDVVDKNPIDGDVIALICDVGSNSQVNGYQFYFKGNPLSSKVKDKIYNVAVSTGRMHNGAYSCKAFIDTVASDMSSTVEISGD